MSLAAVGGLFGVTLPTTGPFALKGHVAHDAGAWKVRIADARVGTTRLAGEFEFATEGKTPRLTGQLEGTRLALKDLGPTIGGPASTVAAAGPSDRVLPRRDFDIPSLSAMDADIRVDLDVLDLNTSALEPLKPLKLHLTLEAGVLGLGEIDAGVGGGRLQGRMSYDGSAKTPVWRTALRMTGVDLAGWVKGGRNDSATVGSSAATLARARAQGRAKPEQPTALLTGRLDANLQLAGSGRSTADVLASLDGQGDFVVRDGGHRAGCAESPRRAARVLRYR